MTVVPPFDTALLATARQALAAADLQTARLLSVGDVWTVSRDPVASGTDDGIFGPGDSPTVTPPVTHTITASVFQQRPPTLVIAAAQQYDSTPVWRLVAAEGTDVLAGDVLSNAALRFQVQAIEPALGAVHAPLRRVP